MLIFHVDSFTCTITQKGRSPLVETPTSPSAHVEQGLLVLASAEAEDVSAPERVRDGATAEIVKLAEQLKVQEVMLLPFAHLFAEPADPSMALSIIDGVADQLRERQLRVERPPFGWFHTWDLQAKGHPLSRVARTVRP
jgi:threonyl-tRNA synthetase